MAWFKLPEELLHLHLPYSAVILAAILYDADVKYTQHIIIKQKEIAQTMNADLDTITNGVKRLYKAGIILDYKSVGNATAITLKEGVIPPRQTSGKAYQKKLKPSQPQNSSIDPADLEKLVNNF